MMRPDSDPFFVGYHPRAPASIARALKRYTLALLFAAAFLAVALARWQPRAEPGVFEYGHQRTITGRLKLDPYPMLLVPAGGAADRGTVYRHYLLVGRGKRGAGSGVSGSDGDWVELTGTRIARGSREMYEIVPGAMHPAPPPAGLPRQPLAAVPLGRLRLTGEVVDSKCWLGVMKPGRGIVHRGCATRCLSGGIPPLLMLQDSAGRTVHVLLTGATGEPASERFLPLVGREVTLEGEVVEEGDLLVMRVDSTAGSGD